MNDRLDLTVASWLEADAPGAAPSGVLDGAMARVAELGQERFVTQRLLGDAVGRRRDVRLALALGLLSLAMVGGVMAFGALVPRPTPSEGPLSNGPILFRAIGAGADLTGEDVDVRHGEQDLYAFDEAGGIRRVIGDDADDLLGFCPTISPDGTLLAYEELDRTTVTPTQAPIPEGATFGPAPSYAGPIARDFAIVTLDASGSPAGEPRRIVPPGPPDSFVDCPRWSPDGTSLAFLVGGEDVSTLWVATVDGTPSQLDLPVTISGGNFDWAPDGRSLLVADPTTVWLVPVNGGARTPLIDIGAERADWSPDGSRIALVTSAGLIVTTADGTGARTIPVTLPASFDGGAATTMSLLSWSPDGTRLLVGVATEHDIIGLVTVDAVGDGPVEVVIEPTLALIGMRYGEATWQGVR